MIAAIYARKSNDEGDIAREQKSIERQIEGAQAFIASKGWTLHTDHIYEDDEVSGALFATRKQFQRMMRDAEAGAFEAIVFYDLDRFGRHGHKTMVALNTLADLGVSIWDYSTGLALDLDSFEGRLATCGYRKVDTTADPRRVHSKSRYEGRRGQARPQAACDSSL